MRWRQMAFETGNIQLQSLLSSGDLKTSEIFYHLECYLDKFHEDRARSSDATEVQWKKAEAFEEVLNYVLESEKIDPGSSFTVKELNEMYISELSLICLTSLNFH